MKVVWEKGDIICGRFVVRANGSEQFKIGFGHLPDGGKVVTMNSSADGMVKMFFSDADLCAHLNQHEYIPSEVLNVAARRLVFDIK